MAHIFVCGMTMSGKSFVAKEIARRVRRAGRAVLLLDPIGDVSWPCTWRTDDPERFLAKAKASQGCLLVVDEAGEALGRGLQARGMQWLVTRSRHNGHRALICAQRATQIEPIFRDNCETLLLFSVFSDSAAIWAESFNDRELLNAPTLRQYHFYLKRRFAPARLCPPIKS